MLGKKITYIIVIYFISWQDLWILLDSVRWDNRKVTQLQLGLESIRKFDFQSCSNLAIFYNFYSFSHTITL
jgi:hypothetical protein